MFENPLVANFFSTIWNGLSTNIYFTFSPGAVITFLAFGLAIVQFAQYARTKNQHFFIGSNLREKIIKGKGGILKTDRELFKKQYLRIENFIEFTRFIEISGFFFYFSGIFWIIAGLKFGNFKSINFDALRHEAHFYSFYNICVAFLATGYAIIFLSFLCWRLKNPKTRIKDYLDILNYKLSSFKFKLKIFIKKSLLRMKNILPAYVRLRIKQKLPRKIMDKIDKYAKDLNIGN